MLDFSKFKSVLSITTTFTSNEVCKEYLAEERWGDDVVCPYCGEHHCYKCADGRYSCPNRDCHKKFNSTVGTIFEASKVSLVKWFVAIYLVSAHKKGVSSHQLGRDIEVTQKTAWYMLMKIRSCFGQNDSTALSGAVEVDEAYVGGDNKWRHESKKIAGGQGGANKTTIIGLIERKNGNVVAIKTDNHASATVLPLISQFVEGSGTIIYTDESSIYNALTTKCGFSHLCCNHSEGRFSDRNGNHTNNIEGFWSHFKRMIDGIYHHISVDYTQCYVDEECFRWNTRKQSEGDRFAALFRTCIGRYTYADVTRYSTTKAA